MTTPKILLNAIAIQNDPYGGITKDTMGIIDVLCNSSDVTTKYEPYILVYRQSFLFDFISNIKNKPFYIVAKWIYLFFSVYKFFIPSTRTPKPLSKSDTIPNIEYVLKYINGDISRILSVDKMYFSLHIIDMFLKYNLPKSVMKFIRMETKEFAIMFFSENRYGRTIIDSKTTKIIRLHDFYPVIIPHWVYMPTFVPTIKNEIERGSYFVCNSKPTEENLSKFFPQSMIKSTTIPIITFSYQKKNNREKLIDVIYKKKLTNNTNSLLSNTSHQIQKQPFQFSIHTKYILNVASMVPSKNQFNLFLAWKEIKKQTTITLILLGHVGKEFRQEYYAEYLLPYIQSGELILLERTCTEEELNYLYSHAECFVFPSLYEGYGMPPMEAMKCGIPCIISDIAEMNWVYGDAALKVNPYSVQDIVDKLHLLLCSENKDQLKNELIHKGYEQTQQYTRDVIAPQWKNLIKFIFHEKKDTV